MFADDVSKARLGNIGNSHFIFLYFQCGFFHIPYGPVHYGINIDGDCILCKSLLCLEVRDPNPLINILRNPV